MVFGRIAAVAVVAASALGLGRAQATPTPYVTVDLSTYVDTSFGNLLGSTVAPLYPTGTTSATPGYRSPSPMRAPPPTVVMGSTTGAASSACPMTTA